MSGPVYLDNNATTRVADEVIAAMTPYYSERYGNPHSPHQLGRVSHDGIEAARVDIAALLGCDVSEVVFTSCGTEGNALVIRGLLDERPARRKVVTLSIEHPSVLNLLRNLEARDEISLAIVPVNGEGAIDLESMARQIDDTTLLVSAMLAQNETGVIHPIAAIADMAHRAGALVHVDAVQAAGKIAIDCTKLGADFLTISGHKLHAPKGVGALTIRRGLQLAPLWYGGGQELGLRSGTEPVPSIVGLGTAAGIARERLAEFERVAALRDRLESTLEARGGIEVNGRTQSRLPNTSSIAFDGVDATEMVKALDAAGICVSGGGACHSGITEPTATMRAMGKRASVRFSLSRFTTAEEIDRTLEAIARVRSAITA